MVTTTVLGPIKLYERDSNEKTNAQILSNPSFESRIYQDIYPLSYTTIRELRDDATVQLARWAVLAPMVHTPWTYIATDNLATQEMLNDISYNFEPLRDWFLVQAVFGALDFGWAPFEVVYEPNNGQIRIKRLKALLQDYTHILVYLDSGEFAGFTNEPPMIGNVSGATIIREQYACNINFSVEGTDWYGYSVFQSLRKPINAWNDVETTAKRYDKKIAGSTWVVYYPVGKTLYNDSMTSNDAIARDILSKLEASGMIAIPDEIQEWIEDGIDRDIKGKWRIDLITASNQTQASFIDRQKYLDALKMRAFGFPERSILEGKHGTKEEADVHADIALSIVDSKHRLLTDRLNEQVVRQFMRLNYGKKYERSVAIQPAPLVDNQFTTIKDIYRTILQTPDALLQEIPNINLENMREKLGIDSN